MSTTRSKYRRTTSNATEVGDGVNALCYEMGGKKNTVQIQTHEHLRHKGELAQA